MSGTISNWGRVIGNGLVLNLDAHVLSSYPGTGTSWYNLINYAGAATLTNNVAYSSNNYGTMIFNGGLLDYATINSPVVGLSTVTVEMWAKISGGGIPVSFNLYSVWYTTGFGFNTAAGDVYGISAATVASLGLLNNWKHYVFEMRSDVSYTNNKIYINSSLQSLSQISGTENATNRIFNSPLIIGNRSGGSYGTPMSCPIVRVYNRALTQDEITQSYNSFKGRFGL